MWCSTSPPATPSPHTLQECHPSPSPALPAPLLTPTAAAATVWACAVVGDALRAKENAHDLTQVHLDSLTRWELQEVLMEVWDRTKLTALMVTHDVDEAILLADRVVMMTNGPRARVGKVVEIDIPRPRSRKALLEHPDYYEYRESLITFLAECDRH